MDITTDFQSRLQAALSAYRPEPSVSAPVSGNGLATGSKIQSAVAAINDTRLFGYDRQLRFIKDPESHAGVVQIVDTHSERVVFQIPSEIVLNLARVVGISE